MRQATYGEFCEAKVWDPVGLKNDRCNERHLYIGTLNKGVVRLTERVANGGHAMLCPLHALNYPVPGEMRFITPKPKDEGQTEMEL